MPQSRTVFAVSQQVHPELLKTIFPYPHQEVNAYYFLLFFGFSVKEKKLIILIA